MGVLDRRCIGALTTSGGTANERAIRAVNTLTSNPWCDLISTNPRTIEIFWFMTSTADIIQPIGTTYNQQIVSVRTSGLSGNSDANHNFRVYAWSINLNDVVIRVVVRDNNGARIVIDTAIPLVNNLNVWWHTVVCKEENNTTSPWTAFHGRVGLDVFGNATTQDQLGSSYFVGQTTQGSGDRMYGFRSSVGANATVWLGASSTNFTGTASTATSVLRGGIAEFRVWSDNRRLVNPFGADGLNDLRDEFIDGTQFPTLLHCFRLNEQNGTVATGFDDVGVQNAQFSTSVQEPANVGFASHPFPVASGGQIDIAATSLLNDALGTQLAPMSVARRFARSPSGADAVASEGGAALRRLVGFARSPAGADAVASEVPPVLSLNKGFAATSDAVASEVPPGFVSARRFSATSDALATELASLSRAILLSATSDALATELASLDVTPGGGGGVLRALSATSDAIASEVPPTLRRAASLSATSQADATQLAPLAVARALSAIASASGNGAAGSSAASMSVSRRLSATSDSVASESASLGGGSLTARIRETERISASLITLEAYMSVLDIWNGALTSLKSPTISTVNDQNTHALLLARNWELVKGYFIAENRPPELKTTVVLSRFQNTGPPATDVTPIGGRWDFAYLFPTDLVWAYRINGEELIESVPAGPAGGKGNWWEVETVLNLDAPPLRKRCLMTDEPSVLLEYYYRVADADIAILTDESKMALSYMLALFVIDHFGLDARTIDRIDREGKEAIRNARRIGGQTGTPNMFQETSLYWVRA